MKFLVLFALVAFVAARPDEGTYDSRYDNFNIQELIDNLKLLKSVALCMVGEGKCTPEGKDFKNLAPEAVQTECGKCTEKQKGLTATAMKAIRDKLPEEWEKLRNTFDADGKHEETFKNFIDKYSS